MYVQQPEKRAWLIWLKYQYFKKYSNVVKNLDVFQRC